MKQCPLNDTELGRLIIDLNEFDMNPSEKKRTALGLDYGGESMDTLREWAKGHTGATAAASASVVADAAVADTQVEVEAEQVTEEWTSTLTYDVIVFDDIVTPQEVADLVDQALEKLLPEVQRVVNAKFNGDAVVRRLRT